jgi:hypothetical protein
VQRCIVDLKNSFIGIRFHDAFTGGYENTCCELQLNFSSFTLGSIG